MQFIVQYVVSSAVLFYYISTFRMFTISTFRMFCVLVSSVQFGSLPFYIKTLDA